MLGYFCFQEFIGYGFLLDVRVEVVVYEVIFGEVVVFQDISFYFVIQLEGSGVSYIFSFEVFLGVKVGLIGNQNWLMFFEFIFVF